MGGIRHDGISTASDFQFTCISIAFLNFASHQALPRALDRKHDCASMAQMRYNGRVGFDTTRCPNADVNKLVG